MNVKTVPPRDGPVSNITRISTHEQLQVNVKTASSRNATKLMTKLKLCYGVVQTDPESLNKFFCFAFPLALLASVAVYISYVVSVMAE